MKDLMFVYGSQEDYMIGAKRTAKAFRKALMYSIQDDGSKYRELFNQGFQQQIRRQVRRLSEAYVLLNSIGHVADEDIPPEKLDAFFLFQEALNLLNVSCKNLQIGASLAAYAVQRQALETAAVAYRIATDPAEWKEFKNMEKYDKSTKCITQARNIIPLVGRINGRLSNQAVHVTREYIGKSITEDLSEGGVRIAIGSHFHFSNADAIWIAMIDLLEVSCVVEGLAEYSFWEYTTIHKYWNKNVSSSKSTCFWFPTDTVKEDFEYVENERKKSEDALLNLHPKVKENERIAFKEAFSNFAVHDFENLTKLETVLTASPNSKIVYYFIGLYHEKHDDLNQAILWYDKATQDENIFDGLERLSKIYAKAGQFEKCIQTYWKLIQLEPDNGAAHNNLGKLLNELGFSVEALDVLKRAIDLDPNNEIRLYNYANVLLKNKQYQDAVAVYEKVASLNKYDPKPWHSRGIALLDLGKLHDAYRSFRKAVVIDSGYIASWLNLGSVSQMRGQSRKARRIFEYCVRLVPTNYVANRNLAFLYADFGNIKKAKKYAKIVYKANSNDSGIKKLLKDLRRQNK